MYKIAIAMSGGIDSLVAAYYLKCLNLSVIGINFITGFENNSSILKNETKFSAISNQLKIPIRVVDIRKQFKSNVVDYFVYNYCNGKTPSPCIVCNEKIKFGLLIDIVKKMGVSKIATGHYARIEKKYDGMMQLKKGIDKLKDQSYFLSRLSQNQLKKSIFPLGNMTKLQVIKMASKKKLKSITNKESQDICFIRNKKYTDFINEIEGLNTNSGEIINTDGKYVGKHNGLHYFTVGQRKGINCPDIEPYYVIKIDKIKNCLIVGRKHELYSSECVVKNINWMSYIPNKNIRVNTKIRYRTSSSSSILIPIDTNLAKIKFDVPQLSITPGQAAVFYIGDEVIGSGWIVSMND